MEGIKLKFNIYTENKKMKNIDIISIPVSEPEKAKEFYVNTLGFKVIFEGESPEGKWFQLGIPGDNTSISLVSGPGHAPSGSVKGTIIATDDIEKDVKALREKGVQLPDINVFPHGKIATFTDPDGNQWVLRQAPEFQK